MSTDDLDQIARLFRLRESGALTQAEFEVEKARILGGSGEDADRASIPVQSSRSEHIADAGEKNDGNGGKRLLVLAAIVAVAVVAAIAGWAWLARTPAPTEAMANTTSSAPAPEADTIAGSEAAAPAPQSPAAAQPSPTPTDEAAYPGSEWFVLDQGADLSANFGPPEATSHYSLECHADRQTISFVSWGADATSGNMATVEVAGADPFAGNIEFSSEGMGSGTIAIPADSALFNDLINGKSPLRVKWNKGAVDELPNAPKLQDFLKLCRQRSGL